MSRRRRMERSREEMRFKIEREIMGGSVGGPRVVISDR